MNQEDLAPGDSIYAPPEGSAPSATDLLGAVLDGVADGVTAQDVSGRLVYANAVGAQMSGYASPEAMLAAPPLDYLERFELLDDAGAPLPIARLPGRRVLEGAPAAELTVQVRERATGVTRWTVVTSRPVRDAHGRLRLVVNIFRDITPLRLAEAEAAAQARRNAVVAELGAQGLAGGSLQRLLDDAVGAVARTLDADYCKVLELLPDGLALRLRAGVGWHAGLVGHATVPSGLQSQAGYTLASREPVIVDDLRTEPRFSGPALLHEHGVVSGISVIIHGPVRPFGVLGVHTARRRAFTRSDIDFVQAVANILATAIDRTRSERADRALAAIVESSSDAIFSKTLDGIITSWNAAAERLYGYTFAEVVGRSVLLLVPAERTREITTILGRLARGERIEHFETVRVRKDGARLDVHLTVSPILDGSGQVIGASTIARDITARKRAEAAARFLHEAGEVIGTSLDYEVTLERIAHLAVPRIADWCAVDVTQPDGTLRRLGVAPEDEAKLAWAHELQPRHPPEPAGPAGAAAVVRTGQSMLYPDVPDELLVAAARDEEHLALMRGVGFRSAIVLPLAERGRVFGAMTLVTAESGRRYDRSDLALAEELARRASVAIDNALLYREAQEAREALETQAQELEEAAVELERTNEELALRSQEAEAANRAKSQFLAMMSHELRTPLNAIAGYVQLIALGLRGPVTDAQREDLERIRRSQAHLLGLITNVLNFARLDSGRVEFDLRDVPLAEVVVAARAKAEPLLSERGLRGELVPSDPAVTAYADRERLEQVLANLLENAARFTTVGGVVSVGWDADADRVRVRVRDTGVGIPANRLEAIFEPFTQLDAGLTRAASGVGLGLSIARDLARAMGGDVTVASRVGDGSTFTVELLRGG